LEKKFFKKKFFFWKKKPPFFPPPGVGNNIFSLLISVFFPKGLFPKKCENPGLGDFFLGGAKEPGFREKIFLYFKKKEMKKNNFHKVIF
jgi:hypothetical protein